MEDERETKVERFKLTAASIVTTIVLAFVGYGLNIGAKLSDSMTDLRLAINSLKHQVEAIPVSLQHQIDAIRETQRAQAVEDKRLQVQLDRWEEAYRQAHPGVRPPPVREYTP